MRGLRAAYIGGRSSSGYAIMQYELLGLCCVNEIRQKVVNDELGDTVCFKALWYISNLFTRMTEDFFRLVNLTNPQPESEQGNSQTQVVMYCHYANQLYGDDQAY
jgi:hypothetical protein